MARWTVHRGATGLHWESLSICGLSSSAIRYLLILAGNTSRKNTRKHSEMDLVTQSVHPSRPPASTNMETHQWGPVGQSVCFTPFSSGYINPWRPSASLDTVASYGSRACCKPQCYYHVQPHGLNATDVCFNNITETFWFIAGRSLSLATHWAFKYKMHQRKKFKGAAIHNRLFMVPIALQVFVVSIITLQYFRLMIFLWHFGAFQCMLLPSDPIYCVMPCNLTSVFFSPITWWLR